MPPASRFPLPAAPPRIPTREECLALMDEQGMLLNIRGHSRQVARVALTLVDYLRPTQPRLNPRLLEAGALLHDIAKTECLRTRKKHSEMGADFLRARGYPEVAEIVDQHVNLKAAPRDNTEISEIEIVHYADKRVLHEDIVGLEARFDYLQRQYGRTPGDRERIAVLLEKSVELEKRIFRNLPFSPEELKSRVDSRDGG